jgi:hypothetical protein
MAEALSVFTCANFWVFGFLNVWKSVCMEVTVDAESDLSFPMTVPIGDNVRTVGLSDSSCQAA